MIASAKVNKPNASTEPKPAAAPEKPDLGVLRFDKKQTGFEREVYCFGRGFYCYQYFFQGEWLEVVLHGGYVGINVRSLCEALGAPLEPQRERLEDELGDDLYSPVGLPGMKMLVVLLHALPRFLDAIDDTSVKDRTQLRCYQRHLLSSIWGALPPNVTKRGAATDGEVPEAGCCVGIEVADGEVPEARCCVGFQIAEVMPAPSVEYRPEFGNWCLNWWPPTELPPVPVFRRDTRGR